MNSFDINQIEPIEEDIEIQVEDDNSSTSKDLIKTHNSILKDYSSDYSQLEVKFIINPFS